jgi:hypothetical protein
VNTNGIYNLNLYANYGLKITKSKLDFGFGPNIFFNRNIDFINDIKNITNNASYGIRVNLSKYVQNKYNFYISPQFSYNRSEATVNKSANASYWQISSWANATVTLPKNFELTTDMNVQIREKDPRFSQSSNYTTWNLSVLRRMLKNNALEVKFGVYDILNQNKGYSRNFSSFSFTESHFNTLKRFWLLTLTWNLSKNGKPAGFN